MLCASCLVTSSPEFEDPEQTPPELIASTAKPDIRNVLEVDESTGRVLLNALVRSEEDAGETVKFRLLLDYGIPNNDQPPKPYQLIVDRGEVALPSAPGEEQAVSAAWQPQTFIANGCHTLTLMVSHEFDEATDCPERLDDSSQLTWFVNFCRTPPCADLPPCAEPTAACPEVADGGATSSTGAAP